MVKHRIIKNFKESGWMVEPGLLENPNLTEKDIYNAIDELYAYIHLENVPFDFGNGLVSLEGVPSSERIGGTECAYIEYGLDYLYHFVGFGYFESEWYDNRPCWYYDLQCECRKCDPSTALGYYYDDLAKFNNRYRKGPYNRKLKDLKKGYNIRRHSFFKKEFIFTDSEFEKEVDIRMEGSDLTLEDLYSVNQLVGKGYYRIYDNRGKNKSLKKNSRKKVRRYLKNYKNELSNNDYKKVYDLHWNFD